MSTTPLPPNLDRAQIERLALISEESGEVVKAAGKVLRHGYDSANPYLLGATHSNRGDLEHELGDLLAHVELLTAAGDLDPKRIQAHKEKKLRTLGAWVHHNKALVAKVIAALYGGLVLGCASPQDRLIRHADGTFQDEGGRCYRYAAAGVWADLVEVRCADGAR